MKIEKRIRYEIGSKEAKALHRLIGNVSDTDMIKFGVTQREMTTLKNLYSTLCIQKDDGGGL